MSSFKDFDLFWFKIIRQFYFLSLKSTYTFKTRHTLQCRHTPPIWVGLGSVYFTEVFRHWLLEVAILSMMKVSFCSKLAWLYAVWPSKSGAGHGPIGAKIASHWATHCQPSKVWPLVAWLTLCYHMAVTPS